MNKEETYLKIRKRIESVKHNKQLSDMDIILGLEEEIKYYRNRIDKLTEKIKNKKDLELNKQFEIKINKEDYLVKYNKDTNVVELNTYLIKLINEKDKIMICKDKEFKIINKTRDTIKNLMYD